MNMKNSASKCATDHSILATLPLSIRSRRFSVMSRNGRSAIEGIGSTRRQPHQPAQTKPSSVTIPRISSSFEVVALRPTVPFVRELQNRRAPSTCRLL